MKQELEQTIVAVCKDLFNVDVAVELTRPDPQFGDFATNVALQLAKQLGKNPREVAEAIAQTLKASTAHIQDINVAGPGFINSTLTDEALMALAQQKPTQSLAGKVVVAEYSDPNPFKVLHAGHLYTTVVGDAIASLLEHAGATVHRVNFGGDVGLHVAKTMWRILKELRTDINHLNSEHVQDLKDILAKETVIWITARYIQGNNAYEEDEEAKAEIIEVNKKIYQLHEANDHDSPFAQIYWECRRVSYEGFDDLYKRLQVDPFEKYYPESQTAPKGIALAREALKKGILQQSDGAVVFLGEKQGLHTRVFINSAGLPTYESKDLGLAALKWEEYAPDINLIITANDIVEYMKVVLSVASNFYPDITNRTRHLTHGVIKLVGGTKMSSRKGNVVTANAILMAAREATKKVSDNYDELVVLAAVKYAFLKNRTGGDIIYDPVESVAIEGNSGPYLQYAHARARSILTKSNASGVLKAEDLELDERSLLRKISEYPEVVDKAVQDLMPHLVCTYLYELAQEFNRFYERNRVIDDPRQALRLSLVECYANTLKNGLGLLNIHAPERM